MKFRCLVLSMSFLVIHSAFAKNLEAIPLNPIVKDSTLKVRMNGVPDLKEVFFKPKNGGVEVEGEIQRLNNGMIIGKLKVSNLVPASYEYRVRVRSTSGNTDINNSASVDFINFKIDPSLEVADPGEAGNTTSVGVDIDKNDVRDDVQRWINEMTYSKETKNAFKQVARNFQILSINVNNQIVFDNILKDRRDDYCLYERMLSEKILETTLIRDLTKKHFNTLERLKIFVLKENRAKQLQVKSEVGPKNVSEVCDNF